MNFSHTKFYKPTLLLLSAILFVGVFRMQREMNNDRATLGLTRVTPLENAPPVLAFTTVALGGFRGLIANALWIRANDLQENDKFFEMVQLSDWITKLEPHFVQVWLVQSWNMAYNISVKFSEPSDRWRWVQRGIELLRDQGIPWNPNETLLYRELSWFFQHKMGNNLDDAHLFYKGSWAGEMTLLFGGPKPNFEELINPQTDEEKERARLLREKYKMDPQLMKEADELYGPLEWRLPDAHAIYWAEAGRRRAKPEEQDTLRRSIYQTMQMAFMRGGFYEDKFDTNRFTLGPNLELTEKVNGTYEQMMKEDPDNQSIKTGHKNFLVNATYFLFVGNRQKEAARWYSYLQEKYPHAALKGGKEKLSLEEFVIALVTEDVGETDVNKTTALIQGLLQSAYLELAQDEDDRAANYERMAQKIWDRFQAEIKGAEQRVGLRPMPELKRVVRDGLLDPETGLEPEAAARLRTKLGLPPPTNAPPATATPQAN